MDKFNIETISKDLGMSEKDVSNATISYLNEGYRIKAGINPDSVELSKKIQYAGSYYEMLCRIFGKENVDINLNLIRLSEMETYQEFSQKGGVNHPTIGEFVLKKEQSYYDENFGVLRHYYIETWKVPKYNYMGWFANLLSRCLKTAYPWLKDFEYRTYLSDIENDLENYEFYVALGYDDGKSNHLFSNSLYVPFISLVNHDPEIIIKRNKDYFKKYMGSFDESKEQRDLRYETVINEILNHPTTIDFLKHV
jgi:hypothetical protein